MLCKQTVTIAQMIKGHSLGYVIRSRPVPGAALLSWASNPTEASLWAAQMALTLMLSIGWKPKSNRYVGADIQS